MSFMLSHLKKNKSNIMRIKKKLRETMNNCIKHLIILASYLLTSIRIRQSQTFRINFIICKMHLIFTMMKSLI